MQYDLTLPLVLSAFICVHLWCLSAVQALRPANEGIAALVETQRAMSFLGDADAYAYPDWPRWTRGRSEPKLAGTAEVNSIKLSRDAKRLSEAARSAREIVQPCRAAIALHAFNPFQWFDSAE
jgi:hypothetical protein